VLVPSAVGWPGGFHGVASPAHHLQEAWRSFLNRHFRAHRSSAEDARSLLSLLRCAAKLSTSALFIFGVMALAESRENYVYSAKLAEQAERYDGELRHLVHLIIHLFDTVTHFCVQ
jgi:hypothetical protein